MSDIDSPLTAPAVGGEPGDPVLRLDRVVRRFGGITAVDGVSLTLPAGQRLAVIGPNGAGKTTLFRLIAGEMPPSEGQVQLFGRDVTRVPAHHRARMGLSRTFQVSNLFATLSVEDNVRLAAQARDRSRWRFWSPVRADEPALRRTGEMLERVGLDRRAHARVSDLSHGEQRQLEIAIALATEPRLLLLDEPAAGLAAAERGRLREVLESLPRTLPLLLIEHDMSLALGLADAVLCLHNGHEVAFGSPRAMRENAEVQAIYLGREGASADA
jgi:branched-chain amino acid transport system ATP-binding protein